MARSVASRFDPSFFQGALGCRRNGGMNRITPSSPGGSTVYSDPQSSTELTAFLKTVKPGSPSGPPDDTQVLYGEFDPGSGRTLAACLTHASGATKRASARGRAANG